MIEALKRIQDNAAKFRHRAGPGPCDHTMVVDLGTVRVIYFRDGSVAFTYQDTNQEETPALVFNRNGRILGLEAHFISEIAAAFDLAEAIDAVYA